MATHDVTITKMPRFLVGGNDVSFEIREDGVKLGDLQISQGDIHWIPAGCIHGFSLQWHQFDDIARNQGRRV